MFPPRRPRLFGFQRDTLARALLRWSGNALHSEARLQLRSPYRLFRDGREGICLPDRRVEPVLHKSAVVAPTPTRQSAGDPVLRRAVLPADRPLKTIARPQYRLADQRAGSTGFATLSDYRLAWPRRYYWNAVSRTIRHDTAVHFRLVDFISLTRCVAEAGRQEPKRAPVAHRADRAGA